MKSEKDCGNFGGCSWNSSNTCVKSTVTPNVPVTYCSKIGSSKCPQTAGCAFVDGECILLSGCEAYRLSTIEECQQVSTKCVTDGTSCMNAVDCSSYPQKICDKTLNSKGRQCKWDLNTVSCRDYQCSEANVSLITDKQCDAFLAGCITTGQGCTTSPLPSCSSYTGTVDTCKLMKGNDNYCEYDSVSLTCKSKQCQNAPTSTNTDTACNTYQIGCVTTGKGCINILGACSSYSVTNPQSDCQGYIGLDGICEGDSGATTCRSRICDNGIGSTDKACNDYKKGCISNGIKCTNSKSQCSGYKGTITTCQQYLATDGNCKGTSDTEGPCKLKDCVEDSQTSYITDVLCQSNIQSWCISTGRGCVKTLLSCTTYAAEADVCFTLTGSEGKCTAGSSGQCAPRTCESAPSTYTTNEECAYYFTNCVTNRSGCIQQTTCLNTVTQLTCSGTKENTNTCTWSPTCISNSSCSSFTLQSICISNLAAKVNGSSFPKQACKWDSTSSTCINALCTDFTGSNYITNEACDNVFPGCVTNGIGCVDPSTCSTSFQGTKNNCLSYKAYCTNSDQAISTDPCIQRTCNDSGLTYQSDQDCINYLPECLTNGNGCISNTSTCSGYQGTQNQCNQFYGYYNGNIKGARCWNTSTDVSQCIEKQCIHAQGMKNNNDCDTFLKGCLYDGSNSCLDKSATCSNYKYTTDPSICQNFKGVNGTILCYQSTSNQCKNRVCSDNITATKNSECNQFLSGCITKGTGCISPTEPCSTHSGTPQECNKFVGNSKQCSKYLVSQCKVKVCSDKTDAQNNQDCVNFHSKCRLLQSGTPCQDAQSSCSGYSFSGSLSDLNKQHYCESITTISGGLCSFSGGACVDRTACNLWNVNSTGDCETYLISTTCVLVSQGVCSNIQTCEDIASPTSAIQCNNTLNSGQCQYYNSKCYTTKQDCSGYLLAGIASDSEDDYCSSLISYKNGIAYKCAYDSGTPSNCIFSQNAAISFDNSQTYTTCENIRQPKSQYDCNSKSGGWDICRYFKGKCYTNGVCTSIQIPATFKTLQQKKTFCMNNMDSSTQFCSYKIGETKCSLPITTCSQLSVPATDKDQFCFQRKQDGKMCKYDSGTDGCVDDSDGCQLIQNPINNEDCQAGGASSMCLINPSGQCVKLPDNCYIPAIGVTVEEKETYCAYFINKNYESCNFQSGADCQSAYDSCMNVNGLNNSVDNSAFCLKKFTYAGNHCGYRLGESNCDSTLVYPQTSQAACDFYYVGTVYTRFTCTAIQSNQANCNLYAATGDDDIKKLQYCNLFYALDNTPCTFLRGQTNCINSGACSSYDVSSLPNSFYKQKACLVIKSTDLGGCKYSGTGNYCSALPDPSASCNQQTGGSGALAFCATQKNSNGDFCTATSDTAATCTDRTCSDSATSAMTTNSACKAYKQSCKSDGTKCIDSSVACSTKTLSDCTTFLDTDNQTSCIDASSGAGNSCVDANSACSSYTGTISNCSTYAGTGGQCWGDSESISGACRDKQCVDKLTATTDSECYDFLTGCVYNGVGCVDKSSPCSLYQGTTITCKNYKGNNGTVQCWSNSQTITQCKDKECSDLAGTDDQKCANFIPALPGSTPNCVSNGLNCVPYPRNCSDYSGTTITCSKFTAQDGPCKGSASLASCVPRICIEAPATFNTDDQCKTYHPTCITNGRGCIKSDVGCNGIQTQTACSSNITCTWANSCKLSNSTCSQITGQSTCANTVLTNGIQCFWSNGQCRNITCTDYDVSLTTHSQCQDIDKICTTSGAGCVTLGTCNTYKSQSVCIAANTTESSIRCTWDGSTCKQRVCTDFAGTTNQDCNTFLSGCKTSGKSCIGSVYECSVFNGNKNYCTSDSNSNQCLYLNDICYKYTGCSDIPYSDFDTCQLVSKNCVPSTNNCISIRSCENYDSQISCIIGINDYKCGWLSSTNKCQIFNSCTDYQSIIKLIIIKCIAQSTCSEYLSQTACSNPGTDGLCTWNASTNNCRLRECGDLNGTTDSSCSSFIVSTGICTTNGTKCIPRANCQEYTNKISCTIDILGNPCLFTYPVGSTSGTQSCRAKDCSDILGITNESCISQLNDKQCVSNGKSCVKQDTCASYKNQISCNGGGSDGICAFTPIPVKTDLLAGSCQLFDSCEKANKDQIACKKNSAACIWSSVVMGNTTTTSCSPLTCAQKAIGIECYPVPNFSATKYTICSLQNNVCAISDASNLTSELCYLKSQYTYTWNQSSQKCVSCKNSTIDVPVDNGANSSNTTNQFGLMLNVAFYLTAIMFNI